MKIKCLVILVILCLSGMVMAACGESEADKAYRMFAENTGPALETATLDFVNNISLFSGDDPQLSIDAINGYLESFLNPAIKELEMIDQSKLRKEYQEAIPDNIKDMKDAATQYEEMLISLQVAKAQYIYFNDIAPPLTAAGDDLSAKMNQIPSDDPKGAIDAINYYLDNYLKPAINELEKLNESTLEFIGDENAEVLQDVIEMLKDTLAIYEQMIVDIQSSNNIG